jgi:hypothetical protein
VGVFSGCVGLKGVPWLIMMDVLGRFAVVQRETQGFIIIFCYITLFYHVGLAAGSWHTHDSDILYYTMDLLYSSIHVI